MAITLDKKFLKAIREALKSGEIKEMAAKLKMNPNSISGVLSQRWHNETVINEAYSRAVANVKAQLGKSSKAKKLAEILMIEN
jgi:hypothetical protein